MPRNPKVRWWEIRRAQNRKPATYTCPLCHAQLPALMEHVLLFPEGDHSRRRHAHTACVLEARKAGQLLTEEEWRTTQRPAPSESADAGESTARRWWKLNRGRPAGRPR